MVRISRKRVKEYRRLRLLGYSRADSGALAFGKGIIEYGKTKKRWWF